MSDPSAVNVLPPLSQLLNDNPFRTLNLPITADAGRVRDRVEELEMESRLGDDAGFDRAPLVRAQQMLADPEARVAAELLTNWDGDPDLAPWATEQKVAARSLATLLARPTRVSESELVATVSAWVDLAEDEGLAKAFVERQSDYGAASRTRLAQLIGPWVIAGLLRRVLESCPGAAARCLDETSGFSGPARIAIEDAVVPVIQALVTEPAEGSGPSASAAAAAISTAGATLGKLDEDSPAHERLHDAIVRFANSVAAGFYNEETFSSAERILSAVIATPVNPERAAQFKKDLRTVRYSWDWKEASLSLERKDYEQCLVALRNALSSARTQEEVQQTQNAIAGIEARRRNSGFGGLLRRAWGAVGGLVVVGAIVVGIGVFANSGDDDDAGSGSTSSSSSSNDLADAVEAYFDVADGAALSPASFDQARRSSGFASAASTAASRARAMSLEARTSSSDTRACRVAIEALGDAAAVYWDDLGIGVRTNAVARWNRAVASQADLNELIDEFNAKC